jgi:hypothetical protein
MEHHLRGAHVGGEVVLPPALRITTPADPHHGHALRDPRLHQQCRGHIRQRTAAGTDEGQWIVAQRLGNDGVRSRRLLLCIVSDERAFGTADDTWRPHGPQQGHRFLRQRAARCLPPVWRQRVCS